MTSRLDALEKEGLVRRLRDPDDRRSVLVELTEKGLERHEQAMAIQGAEGGAARGGPDRLARRSS